jgi:hypothetical protein
MVVVCPTKVHVFKEVEPSGRSLLSLPTQILPCDLSSHLCSHYDTLLRANTMLFELSASKTVSSINLFPL